MSTALRAALYDGFLQLILVKYLRLDSKFDILRRLYRQKLPFVFPQGGVNATSLGSPLSSPFPHSGFAGYCGLCIGASLSVQCGELFSLLFPSQAHRPVTTWSAIPYPGSSIPVVPLGFFFEPS